MIFFCEIIIIWSIVCKLLHALKITIWPLVQNLRALAELCCLTTLLGKPILTLSMSVNVPLTLTLSMSINDYTCRLQGTQTQGNKIRFTRVGSPVEVLTDYSVVITMFRCRRLKRKVLLAGSLYLVTLAVRRFLSYIHHFSTQYGVEWTIEAFICA